MNKKTLLGFLCGLIFMVCACSPYKYVLSNQFDSFYQQEQVDSICNVERIPSNLDKWKSYVLLDGETNNPIPQYFYITKNDSLEYVYTLTDLDSLYRFKKRVTKRVNKK